MGCADRLADVRDIQKERSVPGDYSPATVRDNVQMSDELDEIARECTFQKYLEIVTEDPKITAPV